MQPRNIFVKAPARLHFGLFSFGNAGRQFGGVGVMIQEPSVRVEFRQSHRFRVTGTSAECVEQGTRDWLTATGTAKLPACQIRIVATPKRHVGLGSGTQLALAVATGLNAWHQRPRPTAEELARMTGRGRRSAIGTYGFLSGGLIVEAGKLPDDELAPLQDRFEFPADWRFVLVRLGSSPGLHGKPEHKAFADLPSVGTDTRRALVDEVEHEMIPAVLRDDCEAFGESVYRFGYRAGICFAPVQGGPYHGDHVAGMVEEIRSLGVPGVGQSSWGPTLFCVLPNEAAALALARELKDRHSQEDLDVRVTAADNQGAQVTVE